MNHTIWTAAHGFDVNTAGAAGMKGALLSVSDVRVHGEKQQIMTKVTASMNTNDFLSLEVFAHHNTLVYLGFALNTSLAQGKCYIHSTY